MEGIPEEKGRGREFGESYTYESGWSEAIWTEFLDFFFQFGFRWS